MRDKLEQYHHLYVAINATLARITENSTGDRVWLLTNVFLVGVSGVLYDKQKWVYISDHIWIRHCVPEILPHNCCVGVAICFIAEVYRYQRVNTAPSEWEYGLKNPVDIRSPTTKNDGKRRQQWYREKE